MANRKDHLEVLLINDLVQQYCFAVGDPSQRLCAYQQGWSDDRIAKAVNPTFGAHHVEPIRKFRFGDLDQGMGVMEVRLVEHDLRIELNAKKVNAAIEALATVVPGFEDAFAKALQVTQEEAVSLSGSNSAARQALLNLESASK